MLFLHEMQMFTSDCLHPCHRTCFEELRNYTSINQTVDCAMCRAPGVIRGLSPEHSTLSYPEAAQTQQLLPEDREYEVLTTPFMERDVLNLVPGQMAGEMSPGEAVNSDHVVTANNLPSDGRLQNTRIPGRYMAISVNGSVFYLD